MDAVEKLRKEIEGLRSDRGQFESDMSPIPGMPPMRSRTENQRRIDLIDGLIAEKEAEISELEAA